MRDRVQQASMTIASANAGAGIGIVLIGPDDKHVTARHNVTRIVPYHPSQASISIDAILEQA
ncbi:MAG: hypothetical protein A3J24_12650 [Deltaproteobacteria bacterium RIFCSPLOWO2_02_FULL_53_8]|nr:MAG: hypothetical protein A3J24_12650 [Deltaproteobacteria bacterium RIFCSPLOWO2_02_FULL_53_8]